MRIAPAPPVVVPPALSVPVAPDGSVEAPPPSSSLPQAGRARSASSSQSSVQRRGRITDVVIPEGAGSKPRPLRAAPARLARGCGRSLRDALDSPVGDLLA